MAQIRSITLTATWVLLGMIMPLTVMAEGPAAESCFSSKPTFMFHPWEDEAKESAIYEEAWKKAQTGDDLSIDMIMKHAEEADGAGVDGMGTALWLILTKIGDEHFAHAIQKLDPEKRIVIFEDSLSSKFQPYPLVGIAQGTLAMTNWFGHKYPLTYSAVYPLKDRVLHSLMIACDLTGKMSTAFGFPDQDIINCGISAIPILETNLTDTTPTRVLILENELSFEKFSPTYNSINDASSVRNVSAGELSFYCIAMIIKGTPCSYLKGVDVKEIDQLIQKECCDHDGRISTSGSVALRRLAAHSMQ